MEPKIKNIYETSECKKKQTRVIYVNFIPNFILLCAID